MPSDANIIIWWSRLLKPERCVVLREVGKAVTDPVGCGGLEWFTLPLATRILITTSVNQGEKTN